MTSQAGYFDLQVNGFGGVDFNADGLSAEALHKACEMLRDDGAAGILATIITADESQMLDRIRRLVELQDRDELARHIIAGIHIEGPFISPVDGYRGAHRLDAVQPADSDFMKRLMDAAGGLLRLVTLAPEMDADAKTIGVLAKAGVIVSAGHTNASIDQLRQAIDSGLSMFTHLGNGCPMNLPRHDNIIQRVLSMADKLQITFIADGVHVPYFAFGNYLRIVGIDNAIIVTDATAAAGLGPGIYSLEHWQFLVGEDLVARAPDGSHLLGSAMPMSRVRANLSATFGFTSQQLDALLTNNARRAISGSHA
jgi:N-acetylglucosamine-6-phosphate deacetylase